MWLLIPAKTATLAKSRLAPVLSDEARAVLARLLLARLLTVATQAGVRQGVVVSEDPGLRAIARLFGFHSLPDPEPALNASLEAGRRFALERGAESLLVLPTDLPWLSRAALERLLAAAAPPGPRVIIACDREQQGTNALFQRPADALPFRFGAGSARQHRLLAERAGLPLIELADPLLAHDLDLPEDWARLVA